MGSPTYLDRGQIQALVKASELAHEAVELNVDGGNGETDCAVTIALVIEPHSAVAISLKTGE